MIFSSPRSAEGEYSYVIVCKVRGGLTFREGHYICEAIHETGLLVALDLMEVNPSLADPVSVEQTVKVGCSLIRSALGANNLDV